MKSTLFLLSILYGGATSAPTGKKNSVNARSFKLPLSRTKFSTHNVHMTPERRLEIIQSRVVKTAAKFGTAAPVVAKSKISARANNQQQMGDGPDDYYYFATVLIGTPPVAFEVQLDTGSADLIVMSNPCITGCYDSLAQLYRPEDSATTQNLNKPFSISYGSGGASGRLTSDIVSFAGFTLNQTFGALTNSNGIYHSESGTTGIFGLAYKTIASSGAMPFIQALYNAGSLSQPLFSLALARWESDSLQTGGFVNVGGVDDTLYTGSITYTASPSSTYWGIPLSGTTVDGKDVAISTSFALIDSGTSLLYLPKAQAITLFAQIPGSSSYGGGLFLYPCSSTPQIAFNFGGVFWTISNADFNLGAGDNNGNCVGGIGYFDSTTYIFGDVFLKNVYSVYRFSPASIGFATLATSSHLKTGYIPVGNGTNIANGANSTGAKSITSSTLISSSSSSSASSSSSSDSSTSSQSSTSDSSTSVSSTSSSSSSSISSSSSSASSTSSSSSSQSITSDSSTSSSSTSSSTSSSPSSTYASSSSSSSSLTSSSDSSASDSSSSSSSSSQSITSDSSTSSSSTSSSASSSSSSTSSSSSSSTSSSSYTITTPPSTTTNTASKSISSSSSTLVKAIPTAYYILVTDTAGKKLGYVARKETTGGIFTWNSSISAALVIAPPTSLTSTTPINLRSTSVISTGANGVAQYNIGIGLGFWGNVFNTNQKSYVWLTATSNDLNSRFFGLKGDWRYGLAESKIWLLSAIDKNSRYPLKLNFVDKASTKVTCSKFFSYPGSIPNELGSSCGSSGLTPSFDRVVRLYLVGTDSPQ